MNFKKRILAMVTAVLCTVCLLSSAGAQGASGLFSAWTVSIPMEEFTEYLNAATLVDARNMVDNQYYKPVDAATLDAGAVSGMVTMRSEIANLYLKKDLLEVLEEHTVRQGAFSGIWVTRVQDGSVCVVGSVEPDSAAAQAGVLPGDLIYSLNEYVYPARFINPLQALMWGREGEELKLILVRDLKEVDVTLSLRAYDPQPCFTLSNSGRVGYLKVPADGDADTVGASLQALTDSGVRSLIVDLRDVCQADARQIRQTAGLFLGGETYGIRVDKNGNREAVSGEGKGTDLPMIVLVNEGTASGAELLAAGLRTYKGAKILGKKTYGSVPDVQWYTMENGDRFCLVTARYLTGDGQVIQSGGLHPDEEIDSAQAQTEAAWKMAEELAQ